jgi:hypothetical protein
MLKVNIHMISRTKLIESLERVQKRKGAENLSIVQSKELSRADRQLLLKTGWLREIIRGWYLLVRPDAPTNDSTVWYAHFWEFIAIYLKELYGDEYCLSAEASLDVLLEKPLTPKQVIIMVPTGGSGSPRLLPYETSLLIYSDPRSTLIEKTKVQNLQVMSLPLALSRVTSTFFKTHPIDAEVALKSIKTAEELSHILLKYDLKSAASRLIGAYQFLGLSKMAEQLNDQLKKFGMEIVPENPFQEIKPLLKTIRPISPYTGRIEALWSTYRDPIIRIFPEPIRLQDEISYFKNLEEIYKQDAYNSLSIEGFQVTAELIERVKNNEWDPNLHLQDADQRNALAARGYYEAFQSVKKTIHDIISTQKNSGELIGEQLQNWFHALFAPSVRAGIIDQTGLLGYRRHRVHIRNSRHVPPPPEALVDAMKTFFDCLKKETHAGVRVILGHYIFVFIHPFMDGNGRIGRFLMNALLASGNYPWVIVPVARRQEYMNSLEIAGAETDILPFARFIISLLPK